MTRIKFCGMTRVEDAVLAAQLGVDAVGMIFTRRSRRRVDIDRAIAIRQALPPFVTSVALFMDDAPEWVAEVVAQVQPDVLQFHGSELEIECTGFGRPYLKAIGMGGGEDALALLHAYPRAQGLLLDGHGLGEPGGSGERFDWRRMPATPGQPHILAGGLDAHNVAQAIAVARPWGVDVSSGIEAAPGIKDQQAMRAFVAAVREAGRALG